MLLDWCRLVGAARARERHTAEVQATLEALPRLVCDDHAFFQAQSALQALGEALAHVVLPQPEQSQMLLTEDAYARAANLALDEARARLFALRANEVECDFSELRQQVIDLLKAVSVAIANGHHEGKLGHVLRVTGLLAVDWSQPADQLRVSGVAAGADGVYRAVACDTRRGLADGEPARFCCWSWEADDPGDREPVLSRLLLCRVVASHRRAGLLQFALPVTSEEAASRAGLHASQLKPLRPGLWGCRRAALLAEEGSLELGEPASDLRSGLFAWEHRLYVKVDGGWRLAPLPSQPQGRGRVWQLVSPEGKLFDPYNTPFDAEPCAPPCTPPFAENGPVQLRPGPDSRLQRALRLLTEAPEQLYASPLVHCCGGEASTGLPFLVGNLAAPKKAAATLLRMPVFGAGFGVRSSMGEPLGGRELSAEVLGSAPRSFTSVQANESRRVRRTGNNEKEITALWNKKATQKASTARVTPEGSVEGALMLDGHCRALRPEDGLPCMGCLARNLACRRCGRAYVGEAEVRGLYRAKRLLEDAGPLRLAKKLRRLAFPSVRHGLLRGNQVRSLRDCFDGGRAENAEAAVTRLPEGFRLSRDRQAAAAYPGVVYVLDGRDLLAPARPSHLAAELLAKDACWTLPPGHAILVERTSCPRETPTNASTSSTLLDEAEWAELRQRCTLLGGGDAALGPGAKREPGAKPEPAAKREPGAKPEPAAKREPGVKPEPGAKREQEQEPGVAGLAERATAEDDFYSDDELFASPSVKLSSRFDAALRRQISARKALAATATQSKQGHWGHQFDVALVDLDFVVLLVAGASFRGLPFLERTEYEEGRSRRAREGEGGGSHFGVESPIPQVRRRPRAELSEVSSPLHAGAAAECLRGRGVPRGQALLPGLPELALRRLPAAAPSRRREARELRCRDAPPVGRGAGQRRGAGAAPGGRQEPAPPLPRLPLAQLRGGRRAAGVPRGPQLLRAARRRRARELEPGPGQAARRRAEAALADRAGGPLQQPRRRGPQLPERDAHLHEDHGDAAVPGDARRQAGAAGGAASAAPLPRRGSLGGERGRQRDARPLAAGSGAQDVALQQRRPLLRLSGREELRRAHEARAQRSDGI